MKGKFVKVAKTMHDGHFKQTKFGGRRRKSRRGGEPADWQLVPRRKGRRRKKSRRRVSRRKKSRGGSRRRGSRRRGSRGGWPWSKKEPEKKFGGLDITKEGVGDRAVDDAHWAAPADKYNFAPSSQLAEALPEHSDEQLKQYETLGSYYPQLKDETGKDLPLSKQSINYPKWYTPAPAQAPAAAPPRRKPEPISDFQAENMVGFYGPH
jgi:hypothetical protein